MTILLIGANGQVGTELRRVLANDNVVATTRDGVSDQGETRAVDVGDVDAIDALIREIRPAVVINAAAYTAVDRAETEPDLARRINNDAPAAMARACAAIGARLVHYSTDYVFDGTANRPYREDDPTAPLGVYGATKLAGEHAVRASGAEHLILRTAWVYAAHGHNFLRTMLRLGAERDVLRVVEDQLGCPTPARLVADATAFLLSCGNDARGTFHVTAAGQASWFDFANAIFDEALQGGRIARRPTVEPISTDAYPTAARRPRYSVLDTSRLQALGFTPPHWRHALTTVLQSQDA